MTPKNFVVLTSEKYSQSEENHDRAAAEGGLGMTGASL
jgi:hypothetical protein